MTWKDRLPKRDREFFTGSRWLDDRLTFLLFGVQSALLMWTVANANVWAMTIMGFWWGWSMMTCIDILLIKQDTKKIERDIAATDVRIKTMVRRMNEHARKRESVSVQDVWPFGPLH